MEIINNVLYVILYISMIGCTGIWFYLWRINLRMNLQLYKRVQALELEIIVIKDPCYRGEHA